MRRQHLIRSVPIFYDLANAFNSFYHGTKIMSEENETVQKSYIRLLELTKSVLETCIECIRIFCTGRECKKRIE